MIVPFHSVGRYGIVRDVPSHELPPEAWTNGKNVRFRKGVIVRMPGEQVFANPPQVAPYALFPAPLVSSYYWLYCGLTKVYSFSAGTHTDITNTTLVNYSASASIPWTGGLLNGIAIVNNGVDAPQQWNLSGPGTPLTDLSNWPASTTCRVMRAYENFLLALDVTESGTRDPYKLRWSHPADPRSVPSSWDISDATLDAGEKVFADTPGYLLDCRPLRSVNMVYKEDSTWRMQQIPGGNIFRFDRIFSQFGLLTYRCVTELPKGNQQFCVTDNDIVIHNGQEADSVADYKVRRHLFNTINPDNYNRSFVVPNYRLSEIWFCYPKGTSTWPNQALIWNYKDGTWTFRDIMDCMHGNIGIVDPAAAEDWDSDTETWEEDSTTWDRAGFAGGERSVLLAGSNDTAIYQTDETNQFNGTNFTAFVERQDIAIVGQDREGRPKVDSETIKFFRSVWIRATGAPFNVRVGTQDHVNGSVTWKSPILFTPGVDDKIDVLGSGRALAIRFESTDNHAWEIEGYDLELEVLGMY